MLIHMKSEQSVSLKMLFLTIDNLYYRNLSSKITAV